MFLTYQQKYEKMLEILDSSFGKLQLSECAGFYNKYKIECLANLNKHEELANFMESNLRKTYVMLFMSISRYWSASAQQNDWISCIKCCLQSRWL